LWSYIDLRRALKTYSREQLQLKRRFAFVFMRWIAVLIACYFVLDFLGGDLAVYLLVVVYIGASIFAEIAPERFLEVMPGGADMAKEKPEKPAPKRGPQADKQSR
jgi:ABC-type maltose transport system permease subunit